MKIATWNVNSVNARLQNVLAWLEAARPDVLLLQELKTTEDKFPCAAFSALGYDAAVFGQKAWNGVAILARGTIADVETGLAGDPADGQARYIEATVAGVRVASLYLPNGNPVESEKYPYKLAWMERLRAHAADLLKREQPFVLGGDYNIIPEGRDCYDPQGWKDDALFRLESRRGFRALLNLGLTDAFRVYNDKAAQYTFWDYQAGAWPRNHGLRIDHFLLSPQAADLLDACAIDSAPRGEDKASDHTPVVLTLRPPMALHNI
ncbi:MAG: exodeoxyribonuclease III [Alphaproteobacteria bacterium]|nr:exodeoxyribonuclease III [Alphaproteobacteria bacterium]